MNKTDIFLQIPKLGDNIENSFFYCTCTFKYSGTPSCDAIPFACEMWPFRRGGLSSGVEINTLKNL